MKTNRIISRVLEDRAQFWEYGDHEAMFENDIKRRIGEALEIQKEDISKKLNSLKTNDDFCKMVDKISHTDRFKYGQVFGLVEFIKEVIN